MTIGIGVTTYNRPDRLNETLKQLVLHTPNNYPIVVVNDGGELLTDDTSVYTSLEVEGRTIEVTNHAFNRGIAAAKNRCLAWLESMDCDHIFLLDDDVTVSECWYVPYVASPEPHLMYQFSAAPSHWALTETYRDETHVAYDKARGCMLYVERRCIDTVGGMSLAFGKHGGEHEDWSLRIHEAGLTTHPFMDVVGSDTLLHCADQDEAGISSVDFKDHQTWKLIDRTRLEPYQSHRTPKVPVLFPFRPDHGWRDKLFDWVMFHYWDQFPWAAPVIGELDDLPFNRGKAINIAAREAGNWEVAIIADGDVWVPNENLRLAIEKASETGRMVAAYDTVYELNHETTLGVMSEALFGLDHSKVERVRTAPLETQSLMLVVPRPVFEAVQGFDERFVGWGGDDNAFWHSVSALCGEPLRIPGPAYHLWHESGAPANKAQDSNYLANYELWKRYQKATAPASVKSLIAERGADT